MPRKITPDNIGKSEGEFDPASFTALHDKVALRKLEVFHEQKRGDIIIPSSAGLNTRANKAIVVSIGEEAKKDLEGLQLGDVVLYDQLSVFYDTHPIVVTKCENIICKVEE